MVLSARGSAARRYVGCPDAPRREPASRHRPRASEWLGTGDRRRS